MSCSRIHWLKCVGKSDLLSGWSRKIAYSDWKVSWNRIHYWIECVEIIEWGYSEVASTYSWMCREVGSTTWKVSWIRLLWVGCGVKSDQLHDWNVSHSRSGICREVGLITMKHTRVKHLSNIALGAVYYYYSLVAGLFFSRFNLNSLWEYYIRAAI